MYKSPEQFAADLAAEERLTSGGTAPELTEERALREELRSMGAKPALPPELRRKILRAAEARPHARSASPWSGRWMAMAAAVTLALVAAVVLQSPESPRPGSTPAVGPADLAELRLALNTLEDNGRRVATMTGEQVAPALKMPRVQVDHLPFAPLVLRLFGDRPVPQPQPVTKEYSG